MARTVDEWVGATDDSAIPARVKLRCLERHDNACALCARPFVGKDRPEFDHAIPLILGGANAESNLRPLCAGCHVGKTAADVKLKAKVARVAKAHRGVTAKTKRPMAGSRLSPFKKRMDGSVVRREEA